LSGLQKKRSVKQNTKVVVVVVVVAEYYYSEEPTSIQRTVLDCMLMSWLVSVALTTVTMLSYTDVSSTSHSCLHSSSRSLSP